MADKRKGRRAANTPAPHETQNTFSGVHFTAEEEVVYRLTFISPDLDRHTWFKVLCGIWDRLGEAGRGIAQEWSMGSDKFKESDFNSTWKSVGPGKATYATLCQLSNDGGYKPDPAHTPAPPDPAQREERLKKEREERLKQERKQQSAAGNGEVLYQKARPLKQHPYLEKKSVQPVEGLRVTAYGTAKDYRCSFGKTIGPEGGRLLLMPIYNEAGALMSLEAITEQGVKGLLAGAKKSGGFFLIPGLPEIRETMYLVEGLATGLSVHEATGATVYVCIDAGNLKHVAAIVRRQHPDSALVIAGDLDESGVGQGKAKGAAKAVNATVCLPDFSAIEGRTWGDWNDLHAAAGLEAVKAQLTAPGASEKVGEQNCSSTPEQENGQNCPLTPEQVNRSNDRPIHEPQSFGNFRVDAAGVWFVDADPDKKPLRLSKPLHVLARIHNRLGGGYSLLVEFTDFRGKSKRVAIPQKMLCTGQAMAELLADEGLEFRNRPKYRALLIDYLEQAKPDRFGLAIDRTGWLRTHQAGKGWAGFAGYGYPGGELIERAGSNALFHWTGAPPDPVRHGQRGTLEEWQQHQGKYCVGNPALMFAASIGFSAKLLSLIGVEGGGFNVYGSSGRGKTTAAGVVVSIDSPPDGWHSWDNSRFAFGAKFRELNDSAGVFDEIKLADPRELQHIAYMAANGHDKGRGRANAAGLVEEEPWRTLIFSTGEGAFIAYARQSGERVYAGAETRMIDLPFCERAHGLFDVLHEFERPEHFAEAIKAANANYYGTAGRAFVERLMTQRTPADLVEFYDEIRRDFERQIPDGAAPAIYRAAKRFAAVACGGELAIRLGVVPWPEWSAMDAACVAFEVWQQGRGGSHDRDQIELLKQVKHYLLSHEEDQFTRECPKCLSSRVPGMIEIGYSKDEKERKFANCAMCGGSTVLLTKTLNKAGWIRRKTSLHPESGKYFFIYPETFEREVCRDHDAKMALQLLKERRILLCDGKRGPFKQKARPMSGKGAPPERPLDVYVLDLNAPGWDLSVDPAAQTDNPAEAEAA